MTKDEFKNKVFGLFNPDDYRNPILSNAFIEFFSSNVCIPKGINRHPYADVLHEWIEDTSKELQANYKDGKFVDYVIHYQDYKYRIKPSDPIYETMWYSNSGETIWSTKDFIDSSENWYIAKETKRELK